MKSTLNRTVLAALLLLPFLLAACGPAAEQSTQDYPNAGLLVTTGWLADRLDEAGLRIVDLRTAERYDQGHVPGAVSVPIAQVAPTVDGLPFEFDRDAVQAVLDRIGLTPDMTVVAYDDLGMMSSGRFFWTLEYVGHQDVRVLHGGWDAWAAEGHDTEKGAPPVEASHYPIQPQPERLVTARQVLARLDRPGTILIDARSPQEYRGEVKLADRGGHIPGAVNLPWLLALTGGDAVSTVESDWQAQLQDEDVERFKTADEIQALLDERAITPDKEAIVYCQTMWRAAHVYFLLRLMGFENVRGYDGSWAEWGNDLTLPIEVGPE
jgi:thiosulfate/3-mercaptopyruvate sulfurtransferase